MAIETVGFFVFDEMTQLDMTGPFEVLADLPGVEVEIAAATLDPVVSNRGLAIVPTRSLTHDREGHPLPDRRYDVFVVPGGPGVDPLLLDRPSLEFIRRHAEAAGAVLGICTGSLLLGAAGLLRGRRAGSHWRSRHLLSHFGAEVSDARTTVDGKFFTSGGVTAGIDMALRLVAELVSPEAAQAIQLGIEYDPEPPFDAGRPERAPATVVEQLESAGRASLEGRERAVIEAARRLAER